MPTTPPKPSSTPKTKPKTTLTTRPKTNPEWAAYNATQAKLREAGIRCQRCEDGRLLWNAGGVWGVGAGRVGYRKERPKDAGLERGVGLEFVLGVW
ncbi:hypothetical protein G7Y79_00049g084950 [Physcia stellaris]|nr:hypothetical protein G7Y79_00049g084950 [Physcia stellaris]